MSDTIDIDAPGLLKLSDQKNPAYKTMSNYPKASLYEEMQQKSLLNKQIQANERKKSIATIKAKQVAQIQQAATQSPSAKKTEKKPVKAQQSDDKPAEEHQPKVNLRETKLKSDQNYQDLMQMVQQTSPANQDKEVTKEVAAVDQMMTNAIIPIRKQI